MDSIPVGVAELPLHYGRAPKWLFEAMKRLGGAISEIILTEYGSREFLARLASPYWFQAFGCVLGFDWHSSGLTTTLLGALREAFEERQLALAIAGGKGKKSLKTPEELGTIGEQMGFSGTKINKLVYASKLAAKVDNAVLQDSYHLYHHCFLVDEAGRWAVIQQGMNIYDRTARRYHWLGEHVESFVEEPREGIICDSRLCHVLDMSAKKSKKARAISLDLVKEKPTKLEAELAALRASYGRFFTKLTKGLRGSARASELEILRLPRNLKWDALWAAYEAQPANYEELVAIKGIGPAALKALALVSKLIYGSELEWRDPVRFSFAHGGKDGVPYPVSRSRYEKSIEELEGAIRAAKLGERDRLAALRRLRDYLR